MKLELSEDQTLLQDTVSRLFTEQSTPARIRAAEPSNGFDRALWDQLVSLGLVGMRALAPEDGGSSLLDAALVAEQVGRHLASAPLVEAITAAALLHRIGASELAAQASSGGIAVLALEPLSAGRPQLVPGGAVADVVLALDGDALVAIRGAASRPLEPISASPLALLDLGQAAARTALATGDAARTAYAAAIEEWKLLSGAALAGLARRALELAAAYAAERVQFDKPIGSFQGVAHPLADSLIDVDGAQLLVRWAIWANATGRQDGAAANAMAWWWAGQAADMAVLRALRTFGGYGVSLEYDIQLYYRRATLTRLLAGRQERELEHIAERLFDGRSVPLPPAGDVGIDFGYGEKAAAYAAELRAFVEANMTTEVAKKKHHSTSGHHPGFHKKLAEAGYAFPDLAVDGKPPRSRYEVLAAAPLWEELDWTRVPSALTEMVAKVAQAWSQPQARQEIISRIVAGEATGALGFSEPGSGSDVFAAKFSAVRDGDHWVMNGQKMFTTNAHNAEYILMLARTSTEGKTHEGLTMFLMPVKLPGVEIQPVYTLQDERTNIVYWSDVRVPDKYRLGEVGDGAKVMAFALTVEHGVADYHYLQTATLHHALSWARRPGPAGHAPIADTGVRAALARMAVHDAVGEAQSRRSAWSAVEGVHDITWGPMGKVFATETLYTDCRDLLELAAPASAVRGLDPDLDAVELAMRRAISMTIYGGASEIHRSLIAEKGLGLPKSRS
jgi:alkylation response protein AidB-like acyl-CoA dehydrogenase